MASVNPALLTPVGGTSDQVADIEVIEITGAATAAANGFYVTDNATPPVFTQVADSAWTITSALTADQWDVANTGVTQYDTSYCPNTNSPISGYSYTGIDLVWTESGGAASNPISVKRPSSPTLLTP